MWWDGKSSRPWDMVGLQPARPAGPPDRISVIPFSRILAPTCSFFGTQVELFGVVYLCLICKISARGFQEAPRAFQEAPRASQTGPRASQEWPESAPRASNEAQDSSKSAQKRPRNKNLYSEADFRSKHQKNSDFPWGKR